MIGKFWVRLSLAEQTISSIALVGFGKALTMILYLLTSVLSAFFSVKIAYISFTECLKEKVIGNLLLPAYAIVPSAILNKEVSTFLVWSVTLLRFVKLVRLLTFISSANLVYSYFSLSALMTF